MLDGANVLPYLGAGGAPAMVALLWWMLAKGHLVTRREHDGRIADKDAQIVTWQAVATTSQAQMAELLEHSRMSVQLLTAIEERAKRDAQ